MACAFSEELFVTLKTTGAAVYRAREGVNPAPTGRRERSASSSSRGRSHRGFIARDVKRSSQS